MDTRDILQNHPDITHLFQNLIIYFLERQRLVTLAILDIAPLLLKMEGDNKIPMDLTPYIDVFRENQASLRKGDDFFKGIWKQTWKYRLHGKGCGLINITTGEPIEWDAPNQKAFRFGWFWEHLIWRSTHEAKDPYVKQFNQWVENISEINLPIKIEQFLLKENKILLQEDGTYLLNLTDSN